MTVEASPTAPGQGEEDCLYPISPQMLPTSHPYVQPHPLTRAQLYSSQKPTVSLPCPLPILNQFMNQLNLDPSVTPIIQQYCYNALPFARETSAPHYFPASQGAALSDLDLHCLRSESLPPQFYQLRHSSVPR